MRPVLDSVHRHVTGQPPSAEELQIESMNPLQMPTGKLNEYEQKEYGYHRARLYAEAVISEKSELNLLAQLFQPESQMAPTLLSRDQIENFLDNNPTAVLDIKRLSKVKVRALWQDNCERQRIPEGQFNTEKYVLIGLNGSKFPTTSRMKIKQGEPPPLISLPTVLFLLSVTRGDFKNAGLLLSMDPTNIGMSLIEQATPGHIFPVEVIFWMLHGIFKRAALEDRILVSESDPTDLDDQEPKDNFIDDAPVSLQESKSVIKLVSHFFAFTRDEQTSKLASKVSARTTSEVRGGWGATAHNDREYFENTLNSLLRPSFSGGYKQRLASYAFMLAVVETAVTNFIDDLASTEQKTRERAELVVESIVTALGIVTSVAGLFPGASLASSIVQTAAVVGSKAASEGTANMFLKGKAKVIKRLGHHSDEKDEHKHKNLFDAKQIEELKNSVKNIIEIHVNPDYEGYNSIINMIAKVYTGSKKDAAKKLAPLLRAYYEDYSKKARRLTETHV